MFNCKESGDFGVNGEIKDLLLNMFFIIGPLFLYHMFWIDKNKINTKWDGIVTTLFILSSIILCMSFPISFSSGFNFDLRQIPFILGVLYFGFRAGIWLYLGLIAYRFLLEGGGIYVNFLSVTLILLSVPFFRTTYLNLSLMKKMTVTVILSLLFGSLTTITTDLFSYVPNHFSFEYLALQMFGMWLTTYLVETVVRKNIEIRDEVIKVEKMKLISQLAASISHEVRNPLTTSRGLLQLMNETEFSIEKKKELFGLAISELDRAQLIITDFLSLAKTQHENKETLNIIEEMKHVFEVMVPYANMRSVQIHTKFKDNEYYISGEKQRLRQCFLNIIKNCIEAIHDQGTVQIHILHLKNNVVIEIIDSGCGMTKEQVQRLGTPYYSTKENGTGMGMMVVYNIINSMQGQLNITSETGKGTCFKITFPLTENEKAPVLNEELYKVI